MGCVATEAEVDVTASSPSCSSCKLLISAKVCCCTKSTRERTLRENEGNEIKCSVLSPQRGARHSECLAPQNDTQTK
jgi:hypothetical protein